MIRTFVLLLLTATSVMAQATFHGDATRTGVYSGAAVDTKSGKLMWDFQTEGSKQIH